MIYYYSFDNLVVIIGSYFNLIKHQFITKLKIGQGQGQISLKSIHDIFTYLELLDNKGLK